ncbi:MAG: hypothetical protein AAFR31_19845 [Cyanobacteria bacterium J06627_8]
MFSPRDSFPFSVSSVGAVISRAAQFLQGKGAIALDSLVEQQMQCQTLHHSRVWSAIFVGSGSIIAGMMWSVHLLDLKTPNSAHALGLAPIYVQLSVNRVWGSPTVDLPPQRQRPDLYAELSVLGQQILTPVEPTPRINEDVYPEWRLSATAERVWLEPGHPIELSIRIFDQDEDEDDKVLFSNLLLDPYLCEISIGDDQTVTGAWINDRSTCVISIPDLRSETGSAAITVSTQWIGVSPGR